MKNHDSDDGALVQFSDENFNTIKQFVHNIQFNAVLLTHLDTSK